MRKKIRGITTSQEYIFCQRKFLIYVEGRVFETIPRNSWLNYEAWPEDMLSYYFIVDWDDYTFQD